MIPASFPESNDFLGKPSDMTDEQCAPLSILRSKTEDNVPYIISCWKLTEEELNEIIKTKRVWLLVAGHSMPPVSVEGVKPC